MLIFPPGAERSDASSTLTGSSTLINALRGNQVIFEFPPIEEDKEKKYYLLLKKGKGHDDSTFSQKSFALVHLKI